MAKPKSAPKAPSTPRDLTAGVQPSVRTFTTWSVGLIRAAEMAADSGYLRQVANLCEWLLGDDRIQGTLSARVESLLGLEPTFEQSGDKRKSKRVVRALEAGEDWWEAYPEDELATLLTWGILLGVAPAAHNWTIFEDHGGRVLAMPKFWHPQHLRYDWPTRRWMIKVASTTGLVDFGIEEELVPGNGRWVLHTPYGDSRPWSRGLWRGLARLALMKAYAIQDWSRFGEKAHILIGTSSEDVESSKGQRAQLAKDIYELGREGIAFLPPGFDLKKVELVANTRDIYLAQIEMANTAIAILVRGGNLSTEVKGGSLAATESQAETGDASKRRFDAQSLTTTIHDQSLNWWASFNFGDEGLAPWPVYPVEPKKDLKARAETLNTASTAVDRMLANGMPLDLAALGEEFEIPFLKTEGGEIKAGQPLFQYHLDYGVLTVNEARARMGLKPIKGGNVRAVPSAALVPPTPPATPRPPPGPPGQNDTGDKPDAPPGPDDNPSPAEEPIQPGEAPKLRRRIVALATKGTENGQDYADDVADKVARHGAKELAETVAAMVSAVRNAGSYAEAKKAIVKKYKKLASPRDLASLTEAAITMAQLGGHLAVREDIPELDD
ncbi:MAG TPA: DUF935 family protein [Polyangiaceae bacterium]|nr:DUF935 family protein [Polyangiaceae bacterium]